MPDPEQEALGDALFGTPMEQASQRPPCPGEPRTWGWASSYLTDAQRLSLL